MGGGGERGNERGMTKASSDGYVRWGRGFLYLFSGKAGMALRCETCGFPFMKRSNSMITSRSLRERHEIMRK